FSPFPLPTEVSALRELTTGRYFVDWSSRFLGAGKGYQDAFQETALADGPGTWNTLAYGYVILRD
ncbi:hypothetical protein D7X55_07665, partial [Corallococcus sp. AB049A]|uniref:hypothetical protein n=1 Tax=Corallococcus sp. AB049A TaxID=2316721 RepID=UPI000EDE8E8A